MGRLPVKQQSWMFRAVQVVGMVLGMVAGAQADTVTPVTWNVVGLDSNDVSAGPNVFPVGVRVCNTGTTALTGALVRFVWDTTSAYITRTSAANITLPNLGPGICQDVFHEVTVTRDVAAYNQSARYHIELRNAADTTTLAATPTPREIYVERLISQNRNGIDRILVDGTEVTLGTGSVALNEGQTYTVVLEAHTATQGYEQLELFLGFRADLFTVKSVRTTYTAAAGTDPLAGTKLYADGCQWVNDPTDVTDPAYRQCQSTGKYGGTTTVTYKVQVNSGAGTLASAGAAINAALYDFSGSSYHYNSDFSTGVTFTFGAATSPTEVDLAMAKSAALDSPGNGHFTLTVTNASATNATGVVVTDAVPDGYNIKTSQPAAPAGTSIVFDKTDPDEGLVWTIGALAAGASISYTFNVQTRNGATNYVNQACVTATQSDPNSNNNCAIAAVPVDQADVVVTKITSYTAPLKVGDALSFSIGVVNLGPADATGVVVSDTLPAGYALVSASCTSGWTLGGTGATRTCTAAAALTAASTPATVLTILATALAPPDPTDLSGYLNTASATATSSDPDATNNQASAAASPSLLTIAKTASASSFTSASPTGSYTLTATKSGASTDLGTVTVSDVLPLGVSATAISGTGWSCALATLTCTRADDLLSGIPPAQSYPDITVGVSFSGPSNPSLINRASVLSEIGGTETSYAETTNTVSWTSAVTYYGVTATAGTGGSASCAPTLVASGDSSTCTATPATGYAFSGWTGDCASQGASCSLTGITADQSSVASFTALTYTVVATAGTGGSASCTPSPVNYGESSTCTATPDAGYTFAGWTGSCASQGASCSLTGITANQSSVASFTALTYTVVATAGTGGSASCTPSPVNYGDSSTCTATPDAGYTFAGWTGSCASQGASCSLTGITANRSSAATFVAVAAQAVPTLSPWALIALALALALFAAVKGAGRTRAGG